MSAAKFTRSMVSPTTTQFFKNTSGPRSILKRPAPLPLSPTPFPFAAAFNIVVSPGLGSPHVHFPNSASLTASFSTYSPTTYDRAKIVVSPNPLALPAWGDRVYSPSSGNFKKEAPVQASPMLNAAVVSAAAGDVVVMAPPKAKANKAKARRARFQENLASPMSKALPRNDLGHSMAQFPRSPYPSAPLSPSPQVKEVAAEVPRRTQRAASLSTPTTRVKKAKRPAPLGIAGSELSLAQNASPQRPSFLSPVAESPFAGSITPLDSSRLSQDFWRSVSVSEEVAMEAGLDTPASAVPRFMFGTKDGALWSPGLPKKTESMLSPLARTTFGPITQDKILSPAPKDTIASYPSFGMVLAGATTIQYPPPVIMN